MNVCEYTQMISTYSCDLYKIYNDPHSPPSAHPSTAYVATQAHAKMLTYDVDCAASLEVAASVRRAQSLCPL